MSTKREKPNYDQALKRLLSRAHDAFLDLIAPGLTWQGERSPELPAVARYADLVWEVAAGDDWRGVLHIELQTDSDERIGERVAEYGIRLWLRDHLPVRSVVVFLRPTQPPASSFVVEWRGAESLRYAFDVVRLWEIPAERVLARPEYDLWPLAGLMGNPTLEATVSIAERIASAPLSEHERSDLAVLLVVLAEVRLGPRVVLQALRRSPMIDDLLRHSSVAELFREEGIREGMREGIREGIREGMRDSVRRVIETRFGTLDAAMTEAIEAATDDDLNDLVTLSAIGTLEQVRARLGLS